MQINQNHTFGTSLKKFFKSKQLHANLLLLATAILWGSAFGFQKRAMDYLTPLQVIFVRFWLGGGFLLIFASLAAIKTTSYRLNRQTVKQSFILGVLMFLGSVLQQSGMLYTTVANAGFITALYILIVPIILLLMGQKKGGLVTWFPPCLATVGLLLLSSFNTSNTQWGDLLQLIGAIFWAVHIILISKFVKSSPAIWLATGQALFCAAIAFCFSLIIDKQALSLVSLQLAWLDILVISIIVIGVANLLQMFGQKHAKPAHAAILLGSEGVFAAIFGWILLSEVMSSIAILGAALILIATVLSQLINE